MPQSPQPTTLLLLATMVGYQGTQNLKMQQWDAVSLPSSSPHPSVDP